MRRLLKYGFMLFILLQTIGCDDIDGISETDLSSIGNTAFDNDFDCMVEAIYFEGRSESDEGQRLIAWSIINRSVIKHWSICRVVKYPMQYSYRNCMDPITQEYISAKHWDKISNKICPILVMDDLNSVDRAKRIAIEVITEYEVNGLVETVTHYHHIKLGGVRYGGTNARIIGAHVFYDAANAL